MTISLRRSYLLAFILAVVLSLVFIIFVTTKEADSAPTLIGGWSDDTSWYNANIGPNQIYRGFSKTLPTSWNSSGYAQRLGPVDYSFDMACGTLAANYAKIKAFIATTPKNIILTWAHEPEFRCTQDQFRAGSKVVANILHAQNRADGGTRKYEIVLFIWSLSYENKQRNPLGWWPGKDSHGNNYVDIVSVDSYEPVVGPDVHNGYTDGSKWFGPDKMLKPTYDFAKSVGARWSISELGVMEDVTDPLHKSSTLKELVAYAQANSAVAIEYWDGNGPRADWRLRHSQLATDTWKQLISAA